MKQLLVNSGEINILSEAGSSIPGLAPITRIGGGEVRVNQALDLPVIAYDAKDPAGGV